MANMETQFRAIQNQPHARRTIAILLALAWECRILRVYVAPGGIR